MSQTSRIIPCKVKLSTAHFLPFFKVVITSFSQSQYHHIATLHFLRQIHHHMHLTFSLPHQSQNHHHMHLALCRPFVLFRQSLKSTKGHKMRSRNLSQNFDCFSQSYRIWATPQSYLGEHIKLCRRRHKVVWRRT